MWVRVAAVIAFILLPTALHAQEKRIALLIGNKDYKAGVGALINPLNDIRTVSDALRAVGFEVLKPVENAHRAAMLLAIHAFATKLKTAGPNAVGFLYYSGHGIASAGENFLIPTDVDEPSTVLLSVQGVKQSEVLSILRTEAPNAAHYLVLDACRNTLQGARGGKGFVPVGQQSGVLVAFAAEPGKTASDLGMGSGPYAAALAAELVKPSQNDLLMFHNVRVAVMDKTNGDQVPWTEDGIQRRQRVLFGGEGKSPGLLPPLCEGIEALIGNAKRCLKSKDTFRDCPSCPEMVAIPSGKFVMGSGEDDAAAWENEKPQHEVTISKPFAMGRFQISRGEFLAFVNGTGHRIGDTCWTFENNAGEWRSDRSLRNPGFVQDDTHPVVCVSWEDAKAFAAWLSTISGKHYRLLSEAEWAYAARAGSRTHYHFGNDVNALCKFGNFRDRTAIAGGLPPLPKASDAVNCHDGFVYTAPVGSFAANAFGLHDTVGNVAEWVEDCASDNYLDAPTDGAAKTGNCSSHTTRGCGWSTRGTTCRSAKRGKGGGRFFHFGFRVARTL